MSLLQEKKNQNKPKQNKKHQAKTQKPEGTQKKSMPIVELMPVGTLIYNASKLHNNTVSLIFFFF